MSVELWTVVSHVLPAAHIRGFSRGVRNEQTDHLRLAVKQYVPRNRTPKEGGMTLIAAQGVGQSKELYEPFFDQLLTQGGIPIRAIWAMDCVHHGASYVLNEKIIGDEHHWLDHSRDLLQMVNHFQSQMPPPIFGMGQSWGAATVTMASILHPRLFTGIISIEAVLETGHKIVSWLRGREATESEHRAMMIIKRRDFWPTREKARERIAAKTFFQKFDPEVFERVIQYDLRDCPTSEHPHGVCLTTPKNMEILTMMNPDPPLPGHPPVPEYVKGDNNVVVSGFFRGEVEQVQRSLPFVYPPVLYLWGKQSDVGMSNYAGEQVSQTGIGRGGSGGVASGQVRSVYMEGVGHTIVLEKPKEAAKVIGGWMREQFSAWTKDAKEREHQAPFDPGKVNPLWLERLAKKTYVKL